MIIAQTAIGQNKAASKAAVSFVDEANQKKRKIADFVMAIKKKQQILSRQLSED